MITTVILMFLLVAAVGLLSGARHIRKRDEAIAARRFGVGLAFAFLIILFASTFTLIKAVEVGVPVSFGKVGKPMPPGVHFVAPWTSVETYPTRPLNQDVRAEVRTADAGKVTVTTTGRWKVSIPAARELYFQVRTGDEERIGNEVVARNLTQAIGDVYNGVSNVESTKREGRDAAIKNRLQQLVSGYGIDITAVQVREIEPDPTTAQSIADFAAQQRKTQIAAEANNTAVQEAKRRVTEANGFKRAAEALAKISDTEAQLLCVQEWSKAVAAGAQLYTQPCAGTGVTTTVSAR